MNKEDFYVFSNGLLYRKSGNLVFQNESQIIEWPIHKIHSIRIYGNVTITTKLLKYLMNLGIDIYFYTSDGVYLGHTTSTHNKGNAQYVISQVNAFNNNRTYIAHQIVLGSLASMLYAIKSIKYVDKEYGKIKDIFEKVKGNEFKDINSLREKEAFAWKHYYRYFNCILDNLKFKNRSYNPPTDEMNALISFINSLLYGTINAIIREVYLNELISYLHEPREKRSSLIYDFADLFKPYFLLRLIIFCDKMISKDYFYYKSKGVYITEESRKIITYKYSSILRERKSSLWSKQYNATIRTYIKKEILRFRDGIVLNPLYYKYFLHWWI